MPVLDTPNRLQVFEEYCRLNDETITVEKPDLRLAVDAMDDWIQTNQASLVAALPASVQAGLSNRQIAFIFNKVVERRFGVS